MRPEKVFRISSVYGSVFVNEVDTDGGSRKIRNVNLQRRYKDGDEWKSSSSFSLGDMPQAIEVLRLAMDYVATKEAVVG